MRIGTGKSTMALAQTEEIARRLRAAWSDLAVEVVKFDTRGDDDQVSKLIRHGGKGGAFVAEIRAAVCTGELQAAMHSSKICRETRRRRVWSSAPRSSASHWGMRWSFA